jgi:aromatic ring-opening dioxygenase LigB subunit
MLCFAAVVPHDTELLNESNVENGHARCSIANVGAELMQSEPDVILLLSAHAENFTDQYTFFFNTTFNAGVALKNFGVISNAAQPAALNFLGKLQAFVRAHALPLRCVQTAVLDVGSAVALRLLKIPNTLPIAVIGSSAERSILDHAETGYALKDFIQNLPQRIAVIVTGDGERSATTETSLGLLLTRRSISALIDRSELNLRDCVSRPLALCFGLLRGFPFGARIHDHEKKGQSTVVTATLFAA